ncbi:hypothetical protein BDR07DRAFT_1425039 [Suillus spraguei]|nr:hypothetical protein BDR07DRAFT_1425039 [Suillus spraguei]
MLVVAFLTKNSCTVTCSTVPVFFGVYLGPRFTPSVIMSVLFLFPSAFIGSLSLCTVPQSHVGPLNPLSLSQLDAYLKHVMGWELCGSASDLEGSITRMALQNYW